MRERTECFMPRAKDARGKVRGALPRTPARGTPPETPGPLSLLPYVPERSSPSRVRSEESFPTRKRFFSAAHNPRALDRCGPFRRLTEIRESGQMQSSACGPVLPPVGRPRAARQVWSRQNIIGEFK
jgi:hypothetical protein